MRAKFKVGDIIYSNGSGRIIEVEIVSGSGMLEGKILGFDHAPNKGQAVGDIVFVHDSWFELYKGDKFNYAEFKF